MKDWNLLKRNFTFWSLIGNIVLLATVVIMAVVWSKHACPTTDVAPLEKQIIESQLKIKEYEKQILIKNATIDAYSNIQLDSVWSRIHTNNPR